VPCTPDAIELRNWDRSVDCSVSAHFLAGRLGKTATSLPLAREWCHLLDHGGATRARHEERMVDGARHCRTRSGTTSLMFPRRQSAGTGIVSRSLLRAARASRVPLERGRSNDSASHDRRFSPIWQCGSPWFIGGAPPRNARGLHLLRKSRS